ncbi:MAG: AmmeMemoRadiSam system protein B [Desulfovibrionaceae bacterium]|nr:AmmeMemoRadiSam system protein B [Desulfovibrionaceae bacterium]
MNAQTVIREPVAIGRFYPQNREQLESAIPAYFAQGAKLVATKPSKKPWALMLPHAGYPYCGHVIGATLTGVTLPETIIILCPNHTGRGQAFGVWPNGAWKTPFGNFPIDPKIVSLFLQTKIYVPDYICHLGEHSIEVLLGFIYYACGQKIPSIVPICVGTQNLEALQAAALGLSRVLKTLRENNVEVGLIISSDMNHYEDHETCMRKDNIALERIAANDPLGLLQVCAEQHITMCGVAPTAIALKAGLMLGDVKTKVTYHTSSAETSGNARQTVGYCGMHFYN